MIASAKIMGFFLFPKFPALFWISRIHFFIIIGTALHRKERIWCATESDISKRCVQKAKNGFVMPCLNSSDASRLEIDFLIQRDAQLLPIEVKAEGNVRSNTLTTLLKKLTSAAC